MEQGEGRADHVLEADAVVIIEKPAPTGNSAKANANRYVARSRAKHLLTVIEAQEV